MNHLMHATPKIYLKSPAGYAYGIGLNLSEGYHINRGTYPNYKPDYFRAMVWIFTESYKMENKKARVGYDMFNAFVMQSEDIVPNGAKVCGNGGSPYGATYFCRDWEMNQTCNPEEPQSNGYGCLDRIISDGWQINYR